MTGVEIILAALAAGAGLGATDVAKSAVTDTYEALRGVLRDRLVGRRARRMVTDDSPLPEGWQEELGSELERSGAAADAEILSIARRLLTQTGSTRSASKYVVDASGAKGVYIGDGGTQHNTFS